MDVYSGRKIVDYLASFSTTKQNLHMMFNDDAS